jgi:hypothetical protein
METYPLVIKLPSGAELNTQGSEAHNEKMIQAFANLLSIAEERRTPIRVNGNGNGNGVHLETKATESQSPEPITPSTVDAGTLDRIFTREDGLISLSGMPKAPSAAESNQEALLLLLYGYKRLETKPNVSSIELSKAARKSGVPVKDRISPFLEGVERFITVSGQPGTSRKYGLNNPGIQHVEEISLPLVLQ